jgi:hypothetical protein
MPKASVTEYLERARDVAALADRKSGSEKKRLMAIAEAWLKLAEEAAMKATKSASVEDKPPERSRVQ